MKSLFYLLLGTALSLTLAGCGQNEPSEPVGPSEHVHQINEYGECATCGEYLGNHPTLFPVNNDVPALKAHECYFTRMDCYAGHKYNCDHLTDFSDYSYSETSWYGHNNDGYTLLATNQYYMSVDNEGKIDGKVYEFLLFKIEASKDYDQGGHFYYTIDHDAEHVDELNTCLYDNMFLGDELELGTSYGTDAGSNEKIFYRFKIEDGKSYTLSLSSSGGDVKYYYNVGDHKYEETLWGIDQPKSFLSKDGYIYIVITAPSEGILITNICVSEASE